MPFLDNDGLSRYTFKLKNFLKGFVPVTRTVNGHPLSSDFVLTAADIPHYTPSKDVYSTEEQVIGTWIDGKPLYRKAIEFISSETIDTNARILDLSELDFETVINLQFVMQKGSSGFGKFPIYGPSNANIRIWISSANYLSMIVSDIFYTNQPCILIIEYTKTTDAPTISVTATQSNSSFRVNLQDTMIPTAMPVYETDKEYET